MHIDSVTDITLPDQLTKEIDKAKQQNVCNQRQDFFTIGKGSGKKQKEPVAYKLCRKVISVLTENYLLPGVPVGQQDQQKLALTTSQQKTTVIY